MDGCSTKPIRGSVLLDQLNDASAKLFALLNRLPPAVLEEAGDRPRLPARPGSVELKRLLQLRARRRRNAYGAFLDWPAWDMLLDLAAVKAEGGHITVSAICISSGAPQSTALRKLTALEAAGLVQRYLHDKDRRRVCLVLTDKAEALVRDMVEEELLFYSGLAVDADARSSSDGPDKRR